MSYEKQIELAEYIENKLQDLETSKDGSLDLLTKFVEGMMDKGFSFKDHSKLEGNVQD